MHFLLLPENVGYLAGINRGLDFIATLDSSVQLVVVGNNDLKSPHDFFQQIVSNRDLWDSYAVVSPSIRTEDGTHQNPHSVGGMRRGREMIFDGYYASYFLARLVRMIANLTAAISRRTDHREHGIPQPIVLGYGACYVLGLRFFL